MAKHIWILCGLMIQLNLFAMENDNKNQQQSEPAKDTNSVVTSKILSASVIDTCVDSMAKAFNSAVELSTKDLSLPLIGHLVTKNNSDSWEGLVIYGFSNNNDKFTTRDLKWVIKEFSSPYNLKKDEAKKLFNLMLDKDLMGERSGIIIDLLTRLEVKKEGVLSDKNKEYFGADSHSEIRNLLVECVENGYLEAFNIILTTFPQLVSKLNTDVAVTRQENPTRSDSKAWIYYSYNYTPQTYTLLQWLKRSANKVELAYLNRLASANEYYIGAARIILQMAVTVLDSTASVYDIKQILYKQGDITNELEASVSDKYRRENN
jgi:hypothetical protein